MLRTSGHSHQTEDVAPRKTGQVAHARPKMLCIALVLLGMSRRAKGEKSECRMQMHSAVGRVAHGVGVHVDAHEREKCVPYTSSNYNGRSEMRRGQKCRPQRSIAGRVKCGSLGVSERGYIDTGGIYERQN